MATVSQVTEAVYRARYDNQVSAGAAAATKALQENTAAVVQNETAVTRATKSANTLANQYDPITQKTRALTKAQQDLAQAQTTMANAVATGAKSQEQADRVLQTLSARVARTQADLDAVTRAHSSASAATAQLGASSRVTAQQLQQLTPQLNDIFVTIAGGMSPMQVMIQQGPQITQIFGGVRNTFAAVAASVGPMRLAVIGATTAFGGLVAMAETVERRLDAVADRLRATRTNFDAMAANVVAAGRVGEGASIGRTERTAVAQTIASAPNFQGTAQDLVTLTRVSEDLAAVMGKDATEAAGVLAKAMREPGVVARELYEDYFPGLDKSLTKQIEQLAKSGQSASAFGKLLEVLKKQTEDAAGPVTPLEAAWRNLREELSRAWDVLKAPFDTADSPAMKVLAWTIDRLADLLRIVRELDEYANNGPLGRLLGFSSDAPLSGSGDDALSAGAVGNLRSRKNSGATASNPVEDNLRSLREQAQLAREAAGASRELLQAEQALRTAGKGHGGVTDAQVAQARSLVQARLNEQLRDYVVDLHRQADVEELTARAVAGGTKEQWAAVTANQAHLEALKYGKIGSEEYLRAITQITGALERLNEQQQASRDATTLRTQEQQVALLEQEARLLGASADERERELAALQERQRIINEKGDPDSEAGQRRIMGARNLVDATRQTTQLRNSMEELQRIGEQAFDRIGGAITEAFANGSLKAVDFKNIAKAVFSEVLQAAMRLAVVNPILNSAFGGSRGTLGGIGTVMAGMGDASLGGGSGLVGYAQQGAQAYSMYDKLSGINPGNYISGATSFNTGYGWLDGVLNTPVWGSANAGVNAGGAVTNAAGYGSMAQSSIDAAGSATAAGVGEGGAGLAGTYGGYAMGVAGIAGGLYGAYTGIQRGGVGGYTQAAGGAATAGLSAAAMYGATIPVYGWIAAAALLVLGALLPGQKPSDRTGTATYYTNDPANPSVGGLNGDRFSQENRDQALSIGGQLLAVAQKVADVTSVPDNRVETSYRVAVGARDGLNVFFGEDKLHGEMNEEGVTAVTRAFVQRILLTAAEQTTDANVRSVITRSGVDDPDKTLANLAWYNDTYKAMIAESVQPIAAFVQQVNALVAPIDEAKTKARELGIAEDDLNAVRSRAVQSLIDQRTATLDAIRANDSQRQALAAGTSSLTLQIQNFSTAAQAEVKALDDQLRDLDIAPEARATFTADRWRTLDAEYQALTRQRDMASMASSNSLWDRFQAASGNGDTLEGALWDYDRRALAEWTAAAADGITDLTLLQKVQTEERLAIERRFGEQASALAEQQAAEDLARRQQAEQSVAGTLGGITQFIQSLQFGDASSLSPEAQLRLANSQFDILSTRALNGDYDAVSQITGAAGNLLSTGRGVYASSAGYTDLERRVVGVLEGISNISTDTLTNSAMASIAKDLGDRIVDVNNELKTEIRLLRKQIEGMVPA
jgi:hypothetical protein